MEEAPDWDRAVFWVGSRQITIRDVLRAAHFRRELDASWAEVCRLAARPDAGWDEDLAQTSSEEFRSERDLITAEETEQWLDQRGLTLDEFGEYFARHQTAAATGARDNGAAPPYEDGPPELHDLLRVDLLISGGFDRLAEHLAWRFAARGESDATVPPDWDEEMRELETIYQQQRTSLLTPRAREEALVFLRQTLTRVELETLEFESIDAAHEALLCLREDGETMAEVAHDGGYPLRVHEWQIGDVAADLQSRLLSASTSEVLGPFPNGDEFQIHRLRRKIEPLLADPTVSAAVDQHLVESLFAGLAAKHIRWIIAPMHSYA